MKRLLFLSVITLFFCVQKLSAQKNTKDSTKFFVVLYTTGEAWDTTKQFYDQAYFEEHSKFLGKLRKNKTIVTGGRYSDKGMLIIKASDIKAASQLMEDDVSVRNKTFTCELHELDIFYEGCIDLH
jgi:hypothetical protein